MSFKVGELCFLISGSYELEIKRKTKTEIVTSTANRKLWLVKIEEELPRGRYLYRVFLQLDTTYPEGEPDDEKEFIETTITFPDSRECANKFPKRNMVEEFHDDETDTNRIRLKTTHKILLETECNQVSVGPNIIMVRNWRAHVDESDDTEDEEDDDDMESQLGDDDDDDGTASTVIDGVQSSSKSSIASGEDSSAYIRIGPEYQADIPPFEPNLPRPKLEEHVDILGCPEINSVLPASEIKIGPVWAASEMREFERALYKHAANFGLIAKELNENRDSEASSKKNTRKQRLLLTPENQEQPSSCEINKAAIAVPYFENINKSLGERTSACTGYSKVEPGIRTPGMCIQYFFDQFRMLAAYAPWHKYDLKRYWAMEREQLEVERIEAKEARHQRRVAAARAKQDRVTKSSSNDNSRQRSRRSNNNTRQKEKTYERPKKEVVEHRRPSLIHYKPMARNEKPWCRSQYEFMPARASDIPDECFQEMEDNVDGEQDGGAANENAAAGDQSDSQKSETTTYCVCNGTDVGFMVLCSKCDDWFHTACMGLRKEMLAEGSIFICSECSPARQELGGVKSPELICPASWKLKPQRGEAPYITIIAHGDLVVTSRVTLKPGIGQDGFPNGEPMDPEDERLYRQQRAEEDDDDDGPAEKETEDKKIPQDNGKSETLRDGELATLSSVPLNRNYSLLLWSRKVPIWNKSEKGLLAGIAAPSVAELPELLSNRKDILPWHGAIRRNCAHRSYVERKEAKRMIRRQKKMEELEDRMKDSDGSRRARKKRRIEAGLGGDHKGAFLQQRSDSRIVELVKQKISKIIKQLPREAFKYPMNEIVAEKRANMVAEQKRLQKAAHLMRQNERKRAMQEAIIRDKEDRRKMKMLGRFVVPSRMDSNKKGDAEARPQGMEYASMMGGYPYAQGHDPYTSMMMAHQMGRAPQFDLPFPATNTPFGDSAYVMQSLASDNMPEESKRLISKQIEYQKQQQADMYRQMMCANIAGSKDDPIQAFLSIQNTGMAQMKKAQQDELQRLEQDIKREEKSSTENPKVRTENSTRRRLLTKLRQVTDLQERYKMMQMHLEHLLMQEVSSKPEKYNHNANGFADPMFRGACDGMTQALAEQKKLDVARVEIEAQLLSLPTQPKVTSYGMDNMMGMSYSPYDMYKYPQNPYAQQMAGVQQRGFDPYSNMQYVQMIQGRHVPTQQDWQVLMRQQQEEISKILEMQYEYQRANQANQARNRK